MLGTENARKEVEQPRVNWVSIAASVLLLVGVWQHVHWSVALCLTLIFIRCEAEDWLREKDKWERKQSLEDLISCIKARQRQ